MSDKRWVASGHLAAVLVLLFTDSALSVYVGVVADKFTTALQLKASGDFYWFLAAYAGIYVIQTPVQVFYGYLRTRLALIWRNWLSTDLFTRYYSNQAHRKLNADPTIDNPDQRMTQDVDTFCNSAIGLFISILDSTIKVLTFFSVLWSISHPLTYTVIAYAAGGSLIAVLIGKALIALSFKTTKSEADLRFGLASARNEADSIAFCKGEPIARAQAVAGLQTVIDTLLRVAAVNRNISLFATCYNFWMPLIPVAMMAPLYFHGDVAFGTITRASMAFTVIFQGATLLIGQFSGISNFGANINRLGTFIEALDENSADTPPAGPHIDFTEGKEIVFKDVSVFGTDPAKPIISKLNLRVPAGSSLLITGPHPTQTSALVRVMAGFWTSGSGQLQRPAFKDTMFLPSDPYLPECSLRQILGVDEGTDVERVHQVLKSVHLEQLLDTTGGIEGVQNWKATLTKSEIHRLILARIVLAKRDVVIADEVTYAVEPGDNELLYAVLGALGTTRITVGQPAQLAKYHDYVLDLLDDGTWKYYPANEHKELGRTLLPKPIELLPAITRQGAGFAAAVNANDANGKRKK